LDLVDGYHCECSHGFHGPRCELHSIDMTLVSIPQRPPIHSLTAVGLTLTGALLIALSVIVGCYCKINGTYATFVCAKNGYRKHIDGFRSSCKLGSRGVFYSCPIDVVTQTHGSTTDTCKAQEFQEISLDSQTHYNTAPQPA
jgi:hypothetical protein